MHGRSDSLAGMTSLGFPWDVCASAAARPMMQRLMGGEAQTVCRRNGYLRARSATCSPDPSLSYNIVCKILSPTHCRFVHDCVAAYFQPSLRDWSPFQSNPGLASWAKFSQVRPSLRDELGNGVLTPAALCLGNRISLLLPDPLNPAAEERVAGQPDYRNRANQDGELSCQSEPWS
jgi:hypothetical protein